MRQLDDRTLVSGQIAPEDVPDLQAQGVTMIVNNRPDGEDAGQPLGADIEAAAKAAGIDYRHVPIARGMGPADVDAMQRRDLRCGDGKMLLFCRSGNRSALAWAVARREDGVPREEIERRRGRGRHRPRPGRAFALGRRRRAAGALGQILFEHHQPHRHHRSASRSCSSRHRTGPRRFRRIGDRSRASSASMRLSKRASSTRPFTRAPLRRRRSPPGAALGRGSRCGAGSGRSAR